jgi:hypothetical protein
MPHYTCEACKARLHVSGESGELVGDACPECGSLLEPATDLTRLVGFRSITSRDSDAATEPSEPHEPMADILDDFVARRTSIVEQQRLGAERWLDDGDEHDAAAIVLPLPPTYV